MDTVAQCLLQDTVSSTVTAVATKFVPDIRFFPVSGLIFLLRVRHGVRPV
jgi:hypothetical protein